MAYLSTEAQAGYRGEHGRGGCGYTETRWHNMPDATVRLLPSGDSRGDIEICWHVGGFEGVSADLSVDEARVLRANLDDAISQYSGINNEVEDTATTNGDGGVPAPERFVFCEVCRGRIWPVSNASDRWWTHEVEPTYGHTAVPAEPEPEPETEVA